MLLFQGFQQVFSDKRGLGGESPQPWLDRYRWKHNHVRPHEALGMRTSGQSLAAQSASL